MKTHMTQECSSFIEQGALTDLFGLWREANRLALLPDSWYLERMHFVAMVAHTVGLAMSKAF